MDAVGKLLLIAGGVIVLAGLAVLLMNRLGLGRLPGDIVVQRDNFTFYFPWVTSIIVSILLSLVLMIVFRFFVR
ncbi:MAG: DUF2905 domain-containing protein [SAR202 cluster bacterium]|nr:DUF2905 domain-containing protein [SAR202 cluster bacterium]